MIDSHLTYDEAEAILRDLAGTSAWSEPGLAEQSGALNDAQKDWPLEQATAPAASPMPAGQRSVSEKMLQMMIESAPEALIVFDDAGAIAFANPRAERLFGYRRGELLGERVKSLVPDLPRSVLRPNTARHSSEPAPQTGEETVERVGVRKDSHEFPVEINLNLLEAEEGRFVTTTIRDVTARKRLEARYRNLVEGIPAVTFMAALDEGINELYVSPQIEQLLGFSQREWLEDPVLWYAQLHPDDRERWHVEFAHTCATAAPFRSVYRFIARDGRVVWVQGEAKVVRDAGGRPLFLQGVAFDITERKVAEQALQETHEQLDSLVQQRTAELADANQELQLALTEKESLLKEIHHRVKNNLQVISSLLNLQSSSVKDSQTLQAIRESQNRVRSMALIHERLYKSRDLARVEMGPYVRDLVAHLFRSYGIQSAQVSLRVAVGDASLTLDTAIPCGLIVTELVSNCLKHAFPDERAGEVTISLDGLGEDTWALVVKDNGVGLPEGVVPSQTDSLGLQLVETLAEQLGGTVEACNDHGTRFDVRFAESSTK